MRRARRVLLIVGLSVIGLLVVGWLGLKAYLSSSSAREMVGSRLTEMVGLPVEVQSLDVGVTGASKIGFRVQDPNAPQPYDVVKVESAQANVGLTDIATGSATPTEVVLKGLALQLRVSKDNKILTTLPKTGEKKGNVGPLPTVRLEDGKIAIHQEGRPEFQLSGIQATLTPNGDDLDLTGAVNDPKWGKWDVRGGVNAKTSSGRVELTTTETQLVQELLLSIPFVPEATWRYVDASGLSGVKITLAYSQETNFTYEVVLTPRGADLRIPDLGVPLQKVTGTIRISGPRVEIIDSNAELAGGPIKVSGDLNFGPEPSSLKFKVEARGVDVRRLPAEWNVPKEFEGQLRGVADLELRLHADGRLETLGGGDGSIENARFLGQPAEIQMKLRSTGGRYQFESGQPVGVRPPQPQFPEPLPHSVAVLLAYATLIQPAPVPAQPAPTNSPTPAAPPASGQSTTFSATLTLRDVDIEEVLSKLNVKVGYALKGKATLEARVAVPVGEAGSSRSYQINGRLTAAQLTLEGMDVRNLNAAMLYTNGRLTLTKFTAELPPEAEGVEPGSFSGAAVAQFDPPGLVSARLDLTRLPVGQVVRAVPGELIPVGGQVTGSVLFEAPADKLPDPSSWAVTADLTSDQLALFGRAARNARLVVTAIKGQARLHDLSAAVEGIPVSADGTIALTEPYQFSAAIRTSPQEIGRLQKLVPEVHIPVPIEGRLGVDASVSGTISPLKYAATGTVTASDLVIGRNEAQTIAVKWELTPERLRVPDLNAKVFQGTITGSADIPFAPDQAGKLAIEFKEVDSAALTTTFPDLPVKLTGWVSGKVTSAIPPAAGDKPRSYDANLDLTAPQLTIQGIPAERLTGKVSVVAGVIDYRLEGRALGGSFDINGKYPLTAPKTGTAPAQDPAVRPGEQGSVNLRGIDLGRLADALGTRALTPLGGLFDLTFSFDTDFNEGSGRFVLRGLSWGRTQYTQELSGNLRLRDGFVETSEIAGTFAGGSLRARGRVGLTNARRNYVVVNLTGADAGRLFGPLVGDEQAMSGAVSVTFRGRFGEGFRGSGQLLMPGGEVYGLEATQLHLPFEVWSAAAGHGKFTLRDAEGRLGGGRVTANGSYEWGTAGHTAASVRFSNVRIGGLVNALSESNLIGNGRITGRFDLTGQQMRSANDLSGLLTARLVQTSVREIPVIRQSTQYLSPRTGTEAFESGDVRGRLANGVFRLERLTLASPSAKFFADGAITLAGRLDLNVVANTQRIGLNTGPLARLGLLVPAVGPVPGSVITAVSDFLSNRTIRLRITGTLANPTVRVNTAALLTEEAVRFFLRNYTPINPADPLGLPSAVP